MNILIGVSLAILAFFGIVTGQSLEGRVRLNNQGYTNTNAGVVEVYYKGEWGTVCAGQYWNMDAANVVCRQVGFAAAVKVANPHDYFDRSWDPYQKIWLDDVYCNGDEKTLSACVERPPTGEASCTHEDDAAVLCADVQLVGSTDDRYSGRVEVYNKGQWYGICGDLWDQEEAEMVCDRLFPWESSSDQVSAQSVPYTSTDRAVPAVRCFGHEETLNECRIFFDSLMPCRSNTRAAVTCVQEKKKEEDFNDDLKLRATQLLLELLQETKN